MNTWIWIHKKKTTDQKPTSRNCTAFYFINAMRKCFLRVWSLFPVTWLGRLSKMTVHGILFPKLKWLSIFQQVNTYPFVSQCTVRWPLCRDRPPFDLLRKWFASMSALSKHQRQRNILLWTERTVSYLQMTRKLSFFYQWINSVIYIQVSLLLIHFLYWLM